MPAVARVLARMTIRRAVATQGRAALLTRAKMHPRRTDLYALGAFADFWLFDRLDRIEVRAGTVHYLRLLLFEAVNLR